MGWEIGEKKNNYWTKNHPKSLSVLLCPATIDHIIQKKVGMQSNIEIRLNLLHLH